MDKIFIEHLEVITKIGIHDWEQDIKQKLIFDIEMLHDNRRAIHSDDILDALDYTKVSEVILNHIQAKRFLLIEKAAEEVASLIMNNFSVPWIRVRLIKKGCIPEAKSAGVLIERGKEIRKQLK
ncbi:dihydroneopterin aldolase [Candidatus Photodesmus katoptron]|uniref:7,8-dihydroneopterin aldolase n=1 Tax=Candidatus Photodesmus katoptron Akat1 TaxID=1236703 RepID=S3E0R9_9GAMM|nr:dihydroneopterin aldolase [Candidatus Photodesmus katoptron]EPE37756.1 dihydroneopterin aldolase [Candidatus Photodesmus katoptron Akat1]KEY90522.1 dihydroneopterin aldolase [Candidatus Photodesmus katoptron]